MEFFHRMSLICLAGMVLSLLGSVILFVRLKIWNVIGYLTGSRAAREIRKLEQKTDKRDRALLTLLILLAGFGISSVPVRAEEAVKIPLRILSVEVNTNTAEYAGSHDGWVNEDTVFTVTVRTETDESLDEPAGPEEPVEKPEFPDGEENSSEPVQSPDEQELPRVITACVKDDNSWEHAVLLEGTQEEDVWTFSFREEDELFDGVYRFAVYDSMGNGKAESEEHPIVVEFKKDKIPPSLDGIEVEYCADMGTAGARHAFAKTDDSAPETVFAREKVETVLYIQDQLSGVKNAECVFGEEVYLAERKSGTFGEPLSITLKGDHLGELMIRRITDLAGNEVVLKEPITGKDRLLIDGKSPALSVDYGTYVREVSGKRFYGNDGEAFGEKVTLTFEEQNFLNYVDAKGTPVFPEIWIWKNGVELEKAEVSAWMHWETHEADSGSIRAVLTLPCGEEEEVEYRIGAGYRDGSGNGLVWKEGTKDQFGTLTEDKGYESGLLVLDQRPPMLMNLEILGEAVCQVELSGQEAAKDEQGPWKEGQTETATLYKNQMEADDVTVRFSIQDADAYWTSEAVSLWVIDQKDQKVVASNHPDRLGGKELENLNWKDQGNVHTAEFGFDGEENVSSCYEVRIAYEDLAGNRLTVQENVSAHETSSERGCYAGEPFILDHVAPVFEISYNEAFQNVGEAAYYGKSQGKIAGRIRYTEEYPVTDNGGKIPVVLTCRINGAEEAISWSRTENGYTGTFKMQTDGDYQVEISGCDAAGNSMASGSSVQHGKVKDGIYTSSKLVMDQTAPVVTAEYSSEPVNLWEGRKYFQKDTVLKLRINDQNIGCRDLKAVLARMCVTDITGARIGNSRAEQFVRKLDEQKFLRGEWEVEIPIETDGNYTIPIRFTDLAGNHCALDKTELVTKDGEVPADFEIAHTPDCPVNYKPFGYLFSGQPMKVEAEAADRISGIHRIRYTITNEKGETTVREETYEPGERHSYALMLPGKGDFKGTVLTEAYDWCGNQRSRKRSYIVESEEKHGTSGKMEIRTLTEPSRIVDGISFWNTDVKLQLFIKDSYSGIGSYKFKTGNASEEQVDFKEQAGTDLTEDGQQAEITEEVSLDLLLKAADNNENDVKIGAEYVDNAGHTTAMEQMCHVDISVPEIRVEYDRNDPVRRTFYNQPRTATVTIRERNFREEDVEFLITGSDGAMPDIGPWSASGTQDETEHICQVIFSEDGDYTFTVAFQDMAGNRAAYDRVDAFTIDQTRPELKVTYEDQGSLNEYYYRQGRKARIQVVEHNFDPALMDVRIVSESAKNPALSGWSSEGDCHTASVTFQEDGEYAMEIVGRDQADNVMEAHVGERFVIDRTAPKLMIAGVEDHSANQGAVLPVIRCTDQNPDRDAIQIQLVGARNGLVKLPYERTNLADGMELTLGDLKHSREMDDLYTLRAAARDLAGNESEVEFMYSVNRFGSVYTFDDQTGSLLGDQGTYYTNEAPKLVVMETNVDTLEFREITCSINGDTRILEEGKDYVVQMSGNEATWKQYTYQISSRNFEEEGTYILTIYSEDRAANRSDNNAKGKRMEFALDRTAPSVLISGVEDKGRYREQKREIALDVQDNVRLKEVWVILDGEKTVYSGQELAGLGEQMTFSVGSKNHWQTLQVIAMDAAGNRQATEKLSFLLTPDLLVQIFWNMRFFSGALALLFLLLFGTLAGVGRKQF